jgi:hypothetical protein
MNRLFEYNKMAIYTCGQPNCDKTYTRSNHLKRHLSSAHNIGVEV